MSKKTLTENEFKIALKNYFKGNADKYKMEYYSKEEVCSLYNQDVRFDLGIATYSKDPSSFNQDIKLIGIEIKTDKDTFKRLSTQLPNYVKVFDEVYIAIQSKEIPEQIPQFIGVIRVNEKQEITIERHSQIAGTGFDDYMNSFVFKRLIAELDFNMNDKNAELLHTTLDKIYGLRKKLMANTFFGTRVSDPTNSKEMKFTIPLLEKEKELIKSLFASRQSYLTEKKAKK